MAKPPLRFMLDECTHHLLIPRLQSWGHDAIPAPFPSTKQGDLDVIKAAAADDRILISLDITTLPATFTEWVAKGNHHPGLIVGPQCPFREMQARLRGLLESLEPENLRDTMRWF